MDECVYARAATLYHSRRARVIRYYGLKAREKFRTNAYKVPAVVYVFMMVCMVHHPGCRTGT